MAMPRTLRPPVDISRLVQRSVDAESPPDTVFESPQIPKSAAQQMIKREPAGLLDTSQVLEAAMQPVSRVAMQQLIKRNPVELPSLSQQVLEAAMQPPSKVVVQQLIKRNPISLPDLSQIPEVAIQPVALWQPPKGLDYLSPCTRVDSQHATQILNLWLDRGKIRSRYGTVAVGSGVANLMAVINFISSNGVGHLLRFTTTHMEQWDGTNWYEVYHSLTGSTTDQFTFTSFGGKLLFSNGVDGILEYDFDTGTILVLDGAPPCKQLTVFNGRVIASNVLQAGNRLVSRVAWSAKNNSHIWSESTHATSTVIALVSTSTLDVEVATIVGKNGDGTPVTETKTLLGVGEVISDNEYISITSISLATAAIGIVSIKQGSGGTVLDTIPAGTNSCGALEIIQDATVLLGSGYEDLISTPGGQLDQQRGVWPITDTIALCVRSKSVWQMMATGNFDAPFVFARLYDSIGSDAPASIVALPSAIVGLFNDNVYIMSHQMLQPIGDVQMQDGRCIGVRDVILSETTNPAGAIGMFDPITRNYWLTNQTYVYRYSILDQGWTRHQYPYAVRHIMQTKSAISGLSIAQLSGTIASLVGTIADLVGTVALSGNYFVSLVSGTGYVIHEDPTATNDADGEAGTVSSDISIATGAIMFASSLRRNQIVQVQLECTVDYEQDLLLELSRDGGVSWETYSTVTALTGANVILPFRHTVDSRLISLRLSSTVLGQLTIVGLWALGQPGALVIL